MSGSMRRFDSPAGLLAMFESYLPRWLWQLADFDQLRAVYARLPPEAALCEIAVELHLANLSVDGFLSHPLIGKACDLLPDTMDKIIATCAPSRRASWAPTAAVAARVASAGPELRRLLSSFCLSIDAAELRTGRGPEVFYLTVRDLRPLVPTNELVFSPAIDALCKLLLGDSYGPHSADTLRAVARRARPSHRLAHVGTTDAGPAPRLKTYFFGRFEDHLALCSELPCDREMAEYLARLATLRAWYDRELTLVVDLDDGHLRRVDLELYFEPGELKRNKALRASLFAFPLLTSALDARRLRSIRELFARGKIFLERPGFVPAYGYPSHLKVTKSRGQVPLWKLYLCFGVVA